MSVPDLELPADVEVPTDGVVELELLIDASGVPTVESCGASEAICERVGAAIAGAVFEPAHRDGVAVPALIGMRFRIEAAPQPDAGSATEPNATAEVTRTTDRPATEGLVLEYGATATVLRPPAGALRLSLEETRDLPGAFGDPFRSLEALPGVTPIISGLPYFYVRSAPPSGTLYVYDHITLPALYHLGLGPSVVHPRMIGPLRLYSGVPPARFGRFIGGVIEAEGPGERDNQNVRGEAEVRLLDVNAFVQTDLGRGDIAVAGRYGYPGLLLSIFSPEVNLAYWDYQVRLDHPLGQRTSLELVALGTYDSLTTTNDTGPGAEEGPGENSLIIHFHRYEARLLQHHGPLELGTALRFGIEESGLDEEVSLYATTLGPRMWLTLKGDGVEFRAGAEMIGAAGGMEFSPPTDGSGGGPGNSDDAQSPSRNEVFASAAARNAAAVFTELTYDISPSFTLDLGLRSDTWVTGATAEAALDPRLRVTWHVRDDVDLHLAGGVARQPAVFFIPLPGLTETAIDRGLQTAAQMELGVVTEPVEDLDIEAELFMHRYWDLLFPDLFFDDQVCLEADAVCRDLSPDPRANGLAYGAELFVRRDPEHRLSGFLSYTLAFSELDAINGIDYSPSYDIRHVLNVAGSWRIGGGFSAGLRLHLRSGKPVGIWYLSTDDFALGRYEQRLPPFFRADGLLAYAWSTSWGEMRLALEWLNLTFAEEPNGLICGDELLGAPRQPCPVEYIPAIVAPNLGLRGTF